MNTDGVVRANKAGLAAQVQVGQAVPGTPGLYQWSTGEQFVPSGPLDSAIPEAPAEGGVYSTWPRHIQRENWQKLQIWRRLSSHRGCTVEQVHTAGFF